MSRGFGCWERRLLHATASAVVMPVASVVKSAVVTPSRSDYTSARRAARTLATGNQLSALYAYTCPKCGRVQDRPDPQPCCITPRAMLSVTAPSRRHLVRYPAPVPGGQPPAWLSAASAAPPGLPAPTAGDLARLAARRLWEALDAGTITVTPRDAATLLRLAAETGHDTAVAERDEARQQLARWQHGLRETLWLVRRRLGADGWQRFAADLRADRLLQDLWPQPGPGP